MPVAPVLVPPRLAARGEDRVRDRVDVRNADVLHGDDGDPPPEPLGVDVDEEAGAAQRLALTVAPDGLLQRARGEPPVDTREWVHRWFRLMFC